MTIRTFKWVPHARVPAMLRSGRYRRLKTHVPSHHDHWSELLERVR